MSLAGRAQRSTALAFSAAALALLAACSTVGPGGTPGEGGAAGGGKLRPLAKQPAQPAGAQPRSHVASTNYDITVPGAGDQLPGDGMPEDGGRAVFERGGASWYGMQFHQRKTASGERFDMGAFTAAHKTLPFNTRVCVRSLVNGREVLVRINDRGPYAAGRVIDLSRAAADALGMVGLGIKQVALSIVDRDDMRCGGEEVGPAETPAAAAPEAPAPARRRIQIFKQRRR